jgi:hypothetical protein
MLLLVWQVIACMALWSVAWGFFFFLVQRKKMDYTKYFLRTTFYFLSVAVVTSWLFADSLIRITKNISATPWILFGIVLVATVFIYRYTLNYFQEPKEYFDRYPRREFLKISGERLLSKSTDILAQQVFIVLLITFFHDAGFSLAQTIIAFGILFSLLHIPLMVSERGAWPAWTFGGAVIVFSLIFPVIILNVHYGFVYTYLIHWAFYTIMAAVFWIRNAKPRFVVA